jgi:hypothetical protein
MRRSGRRLTILAATVAAATVALIVFSATSKHDITGDLTLTDPSHVADTDADCTGHGGYSDITEGAQVTVKNGDGKTLGTGELGPGVSDGTSCVFDFTVKGLRRSDFYAIAVSHRGDITFSRKQLEGDKWFAGLTLGG